MITQGQSQLADKDAQCKASTEVLLKTIQDANLLLAERQKNQVDEKASLLADINDKSALI